MKRVSRNSYEATLQLLTWICVLHVTQTVFRATPGNGELRVGLAHKFLSFCRPKSRYTSFAPYRAGSNCFNSEMKWVNESGFLKFSVTPPLNRICHPKILRALDRAVIVFELSAQRMLARARTRACGQLISHFSHAELLGWPVRNFQNGLPAGCLHLVCTWQRRKFWKFSTGARFAPDPPKFFR